jgi:hypothetical protein
MEAKFYFVRFQTTGNENLDINALFKWQHF